MLNSMNYLHHMYTVWQSLHSYREECLSVSFLSAPEDQEKYDEEWDDITAAMSWIATGLGLTDEEVFNYDPTTDY